MAAPAPHQEEPIDLSVRPRTSASSDVQLNGETELGIDVGVDEPVKSVPLDLTLDRQTDVATK